MTSLQFPCCKNVFLKGRNFVLFGRFLMKLCVQFCGLSPRRDARGSVPCFRILRFHILDAEWESEQSKVQLGLPSLFLEYLVLLCIYKTLHCGMPLICQQWWMLFLGVCYFHQKQDPGIDCSSNMFCFSVPYVYFTPTLKHARPLVVLLGSWSTY